MSELGHFCFSAWLNVCLDEAITWTSDHLPLAGPIRDRLQICSCTKTHLHENPTKCWKTFCWWHFQMDFHMSVDILLRSECVQTISFLPSKCYWWSDIIDVGPSGPLSPTDKMSYHRFSCSLEAMWDCVWNLLHCSQIWLVSHSSASMIPIKFQRLDSS